MGLRQDAATWLAEQEEEHDSTDVVYETPAGSVPVTAVLGSQLLRYTDRKGNVKVERTERDFLIRAAALVIDGDAVTPERGHKIYLTLGDTTEVFEVMAPQGEAAWRYSDHFKTRFRIHSKYVSTVAVAAANVLWNEDEERWDHGDTNWEDD